MGDAAGEDAPIDLSSVPMAVNVPKFLRETSHFDAFKVGAYLRLMIRYWASGPFLDDWAELAATCSMSPDLWKSANVSLMRLFRKGSDGCWHHDDLDKQRALAIERVTKFRARGRKASATRWGAKTGRNGRDGK